MRVSERNAGHMILRMEPNGDRLGPDLLPPVRDHEIVDFSNCPLACREELRIARWKKKRRRMLGFVG